MLYNYKNDIPLGLAVAFIHHPCILTKAVVSFLSRGTYSTSHYYINVSQIAAQFDKLIIEYCIVGMLA